MKKILVLCLAIAIPALGRPQTHVSDQATNDAIGPSMGSFVYNSVLHNRIAYLCGSTSGGTGSSIVIVDYNSSMTVLGQAVINSEYDYTRPQLSRDGKSIAFYARADQISAPHRVYFAALSNTPYTALSPTPPTGVTPTAAPHNGVVTAGTPTVSDTTFTSGSVRPPAVSSDDRVVWPDLNRGSGTDTPLMHWNTGTNVVDDITGSDDWDEPGLGADMNKLVFSYNGQIYRSDYDPTAFPTAETHDNWTTGDWTVSRYSGTDGNNTSSQPQMSVDGDEVVFRTLASNLRASDGNLIADIYWWRAADGPIVAYADTGSDVGDMRNPHISADGANICFVTTSHVFGTGIDYGGGGSIVGPWVWQIARSTTLGTPSIVSRAPTGSPIPAKKGDMPVTSRLSTTTYVAFQTTDTGIASGDTRTGTDVVCRP